MFEVEPITTIAVDGEQYAVEAMSAEAKRLVSILHHWREEEANMRVDLMKTQGAQRDISRELVALIRKEKAEATADATEAPAEPAAEAAPEEAPDA